MNFNASLSPEGACNNQQQQHQQQQSAAPAAITSSILILRIHRSRGRQGTTHANTQTHVARDSGRVLPLRCLAICFPSTWASTSWAGLGKRGGRPFACTRACLHDCTRACGQTQPLTSDAPIRNPRISRRLIPWEPRYERKHESAPRRIADCCGVQCAQAFRGFRNALCTPLPLKDPRDSLRSEVPNRKDFKPL